MTGRTNENFFKPFSPPQPLMVSSANEELVAGLPSHFTKPSFASISFWCNQDCTVVVNGEYELKINKDFGLELAKRFDRIYSFIIEEQGIEYYFLASF